MHHRRVCSPRRLALLARMREAKARKRMFSAPEREPRLVRWFPLEFGVRDKATGEIAWNDLRSARDVFRRVTVLLKHYVPGNPQSAIRNWNVRNPQLDNAT